MKRAEQNSQLFRLSKGVIEHSHPFITFQLNYFLQNLIDQIDVQLLPLLHPLLQKGSHSNRVIPIIILFISYYNCWIYCYHLCLRGMSKANRIILSYSAEEKRQRERNVEINHTLKREMIESARLISLLLLGKGTRVHRSEDR